MFTDKSPRLPQTAYASDLKQAESKEREGLVTSGLGLGRSLSLMQATATDARNFNFSTSSNLDHSDSSFF